jgi:hypothetical protein
MQDEKKHAFMELIVGTVIVMLVACVLLNATATIVRNQQYLPQAITDPPIGNLINIVATLYAVGAVVFGAWLIARPNAKFEKLNQRLTIKGVLPGYFLIALVPVGMGLAIIVLTRQIAWGFWLACSSLVASLLFLIVALRSYRSSR